jgi:hypothetical protein
MSFLPKEQRRVNIVMIDGEVHSGQVFAYEGERIVDLMNDDRKFIPFFDKNNREVIVINKSQIRAINLFDEEG